MDASLFGIAMGCMTGIRFPERTENFYFHHMSKLAMTPTKPKGNRGPFPRGAVEADHFPQSSAEVFDYAEP
jgi:hypothetical protein